MTNNKSKSNKTKNIDKKENIKNKNINTNGKNIENSPFKKSLKNFVEWLSHRQSSISSDDKEEKKANNRLRNGLVGILMYIVFFKIYEKKIMAGMEFKDINAVWQTFFYSFLIVSAGIFPICVLKKNIKLNKHKVSSRILLYINIFFMAGFCSFLIKSLMFIVTSA